MKGISKMSEETISKSKQKRLAQQQAREEQRKKKVVKTFWLIFIPVAIVLVIAGCILYSDSQKLNYSKYLNQDGTIANIDVSQNITASYDTLSFSKSELMPSEETVQSDIDSLVEEHATINETRKIAAADTVNISYTATADGVAVKSVTAEEGGEDITIGDATIDAAIDEALIGHVGGDQVVEDVTYEEDYYDSTMAGKTVTYNITVKGAYDYPEFDDSFVAEYCSDKASTAAEYREKITNDYYTESLKDEITDSISLNCVVNTYPDKFLENTEKITRESDKANYEYTKQMYESYGLSLNSIYEMYGLDSEEAYTDHVLSASKDTVRDAMFYQYVFENEGMTNTEDDVKAYFMSTGIDEATYSSYVSKFGYNYLANEALKARVLDKLTEIVTITE